MDMEMDIELLKKMATELYPVVEELMRPDKEIWELAIAELRVSSLKMYEFIENQSDHPEIFGREHSEAARVFLKKIDDSHSSREEELKAITARAGAK